MLRLELPKRPKREKSGESLFSPRIRKSKDSPKKKNKWRKSPTIDKSKPRDPKTDFLLSPRRNVDPLRSSPLRTSRKSSKDRNKTSILDDSKTYFAFKLEGNSHLFRGLPVDKESLLMDQIYALDSICPTLEEISDMFNIYLPKSDYIAFYSPYSKMFDLIRVIGKLGVIKITSVKTQLRFKNKENNEILVVLPLNFNLIGNIGTVDNFNAYLMGEEPKNISDSVDRELKATIEVLGRKSQTTSPRDDLDAKPVLKSKELEKLGGYSDYDSSDIPSILKDYDPNLSLKTCDSEDDAEEEIPTSKLDPNAEKYKQIEESLKQKLKSRNGDLDFPEDDSNDSEFIRNVDNLKKKHRSFLKKSDIAYEETEEEPEIPNDGVIKTKVKGALDYVKSFI